ncbi:MAG: dCTP deaminase [Thermoplasmata archaeon]
MILSDGTIRRMVDRGMLISENYDDKCLTPNGYDLRIADILSSGNHHEEAVITHGSLFFISTLERIRMTENISGMLWIRSSYSRKGVMGSFGFVDAGFEGKLTLSFFNAGSDLTLKKNERIVQIVFMEMEEKAEKTYDIRSGNYQHSDGIKLG